MHKKTKTLHFVNLIIWSIYPIFMNGQTDTSENQQQGNVKKNWSVGVLPATVYNSDVGFRYGAIVKLFNYGDGSTYPAYNDCISLHWSMTTKGSSTNEVVFDSNRLIYKLRTTFECNYTTDKALDFYGFNGYEAYYNSNIENKNSSFYQSGLFYKMDRKLLRIRADLQGRFRNNRLKWLAGLTFYNVKTDTVDITTLNKGRSSNDLYPYINGGLFGTYMQSGLISQNEINDCHTAFFKFGMIYDTRNTEANPMKGIWSDIQLIAAPDFLGNDQQFVRISFTHRQYFQLIPEKLSLACRLSLQNKVTGTVPFYLLCIIHYLSPYTDEDGLGGSKTLRGILLNRVVGDGVAYGNVEFRWKFLKTVLWKQNIYLALSGFMDGGMVTQKYNLQESDDISVLANYITNDREKLHLSAGAGFHFVLNENFIISVDYGRSFEKRDGIDGFYIGLNFLY